MCHRPTRATVAALLSPSRVRDAATERRAATNRRRRSRGAAIARCAATQRRSTGSTGPIEVPRRRWEAAAATVSPPRACGNPPGGVDTSAGSRRHRCRVDSASQVADGITVEQRVIPLERVGCYVPGGPLSPALVSADDRDPRARRRRRRGDRRLAAAASGGLRRGTRGRRRSLVSGRRRARDRRARLRHRARSRASTRSSAPAIAGCRRPRRSSAATARSISTPARPRS